MKHLLIAALLSLLPMGAQALECGNTTLEYSLGNHSLDELFENGEGKPGPRRLVTEQTSNLLSKGSRRFIQATAMDIDSLRVTVDKLSGSKVGGKTSFVVCKTDEQGQVSKLDEFMIGGGAQTTGLKLVRSYSRLLNTRLSIQLFGQDVLGQARFRIDLQRPGADQVWVPDRHAPPGPIHGLADLHNHQAASLAYAGGWLWGSHREGLLNQRLPACTGSNHATLQTSLQTGEPMLDAHPQLTHGAPDFRDWPSWSDIKHQQVSAQWLQQAHQQGLQLVVASLVNNQWLSAAMIASGQNDKGMSPADMESVKRQVNSLKQMDKATDWYTIVRDPWEARRAISRGELAVVMAVEVSDLIPASDGPWLQQLHDLYDMGIRSLQLAHETNNHFSGAAYHRDLFKSLSRVKALFDRQTAYDEHGDGVHNPIGMSKDGYALLDEMIRLNMLIDIAHLPLLSQQQIYRRVSQLHSYYPLFNSHTRMAPLLRPAEKQVLKEFVTTDETLEYVRKTGGMLGLRTGEDPMLSYQPVHGKPVSNNCDGSVRSYIQFYQYANDRGVHLGLGSDFNGFITQIVPRYGKDACFNATEATRKAQIQAQGPLPASVSPAMAEYYQKGLAHVGLLPAMVKDMQDLGADTHNFENSAEAFVSMWERTYDSKRGAVGK